MWLWGSLIGSGAAAGVLHGPGIRFALERLSRETCFVEGLEALRGRVVLLALRDQLSAAIAMLELDGVARRMVLCPPGLSDAHIGAAARDAQADAWLGDSTCAVPDGVEVSVKFAVTPQSLDDARSRRASHATEWILLTSATTGAPKLVQHSLASLTSAFAGQPASTGKVVWSTFYDVRRYGGLQILLRGLYGGAMVFSNPDESAVEFMTRAGREGVTHISGTASHWRGALMSGATSLMAPGYIRLSGEIADQAVLDALRAAYPSAVIAHAFATTEAGVAFEVEDALAGFPETLANADETNVEMKIEDATLRIRSPGVATRYLGTQATPLRSDDGFVDTGDKVELRDGRYYFMGRSGGVINVGGSKVHPEEVEAIINTHPWVRMSLVKARRNPITGAVVSADVVLASASEAGMQRPSDASLKQEIVEQCRRALTAYKVPAMITFVDKLEVSAAGKLVRPNA
jgi:acyl-coenzyme A synthetase/AMP-(fatty) acid ligase